jgi:hypothetical protein
MNHQIEQLSTVELEHVLRSLAKDETLSGVLRDAARRGIQVEITARAAEARELRKEETPHD